MKAFPLEMVWCIITKWMEQSEHLFTQENLDQTAHLVFIEILKFTKTKSPAESIETQGRQVVDMIVRVETESKHKHPLIIPGKHFSIQSVGLNE